MAQYGQNEALTAGMTTEKYSQQLGRLLDELAASGIACVLVSPHELLPTLPPIPSPARFNSKIKVYAEATASVAQSHGLLLSLIRNRSLWKAMPSAFATSNGIRMTRNSSRSNSRKNS